MESADICRVDSHWQPVPGSERTLSLDTVCLAVGLTPNCELAFQMGCRETYMAELGGPVAAHGPNLETSIPGVFIAGDASGVEEASTAMIEGRLAGLAAAELLSREIDRDELKRLRSEAASSLKALRAGPFGAKAREGKMKMFRAGTE